MKQPTAILLSSPDRPLGNFYVDLIRTMTRIRLPIAILGTLLLIAAGIPETLNPACPVYAVVEPELLL